MSDEIKGAAQALKKAMDIAENDEPDGDFAATVGLILGHNLAATGYLLAALVAVEQDVEIKERENELLRARIDELAPVRDAA